MLLMTMWLKNVSLSYLFHYSKVVLIFMFCLEIREVEKPRNLWDQIPEYDEEESMRSTKKFTNAKKQPVKRLGWGGAPKRQRTIISAAKKSISKNM